MTCDSFGAPRIKYFYFIIWRIF